MAADCAFCAWSRVVVAVVVAGAFCGLVAIGLMDGADVPVWVWIGLCVSGVVALKVVTGRQQRSKGLPSDEVL
jgi:threonine/homoserine efflux transporter RhtA